MADYAPWLKAADPTAEFARGLQIASSIKQERERMAMESQRLAIETQARQQEMERSHAMEQARLAQQQAYQQAETAIKQQQLQVAQERVNQSVQQSAMQYAQNRQMLKFRQAELAQRSAHEKATEETNAKNAQTQAEAVTQRKSTSKRQDDDAEFRKRRDWYLYNQKQKEQGEPTVSFKDYTGEDDDQTGSGTGTAAPPTPVPGKIGRFKVQVVPATGVPNGQPAAPAAQAAPTAPPVDPMTKLPSSPAKDFLAKLRTTSSETRNNAFDVLASELAKQQGIPPNSPALSIGSSTINQSPAAVFRGPLVGGQGALGPALTGEDVWSSIAKMPEDQQKQLFDKALAVTQPNED